MVVAGELDTDICRSLWVARVGTHRQRSTHGLSLGLGAIPSGLLAHILSFASRNMLAETSSPVDDVESVTTNTDASDSYHYINLPKGPFFT